MKDRLTMEAIDTSWEVDENGNSNKYMAISERYFNFTVKDMIKCFCDFIDQNKTGNRDIKTIDIPIKDTHKQNKDITAIANEGKDPFNSMMAPVQNNSHGVEPVSYIANEMNKKCISDDSTDHFHFKQSQSGGSYYDKMHYVTIYDANGCTHQGIIRLSNHPMDIDVWIQKNGNIEFGISVVVYEGEKPTESSDNIMNDNIITIYEYLIGVNRNNRSMLDSIVRQIITATRVGFYKRGTYIGRNDKPTIRTNGTIVERLLSAITEGLAKSLNEFRHR